MNNNPFWRLMSYLFFYKKEVTLAILFNILTAIFTVLSAPLISPFLDILFLDSSQASHYTEGAMLQQEKWFKQQLLYFIAQNGKMKALQYVCFAILGVFLLKNVSRYFALFFMAPVRNGVVKDIRNKLFTKALSFSPSFYTRERKGDLIARVSTDVQEIETSILQVLETIFREPLIILLSIGLMIYISPPLTGIVLLMLAFTTFVIGGIGKKLKQSSQEVQQALGIILSRWEESLGGIKTIQSFNAERYKEQQFDVENNFYRIKTIRMLQRRDLSSPLAEFLGISVITVLLWIGAQQVFEKQIEAGTFFAFLFAFFNVIDPAKSFSRAYFDIRKGMAALSRVEEILHYNSEVIPPTHPIPFTTFEKEITFDRVSFNYPGTTQKVLDNVSFSLPKGKKIALIGPSGAGKTTICELMTRFYDVTEGRITIDGIDIKNISLLDLRSTFSVISQETTLFYDTILGNITLGREDIPIEAVIEAARIAQAHEFIMDTQDGYNTHIGDRGLMLSGGQRQRLALARALLRNAPIMIMDEATSAVDTKAENAIQTDISPYLENKTLLIIAHRSNSIQHVDEILVIKEGKIVEQGSPNSLFEKVCL
ncbi:MAG: ABC transporter ATP-binding protein/permease [Bacteroidetes bacterium]|nr:ABC transporter ATP-binding protein/permease [Bacteroidota bacterium]